ncbi:hypothetical protein RMATCC62417_00386 [Rhizopus microsporus]|nr:hypothetical protein RMATCC62417_00386 [Rhizopus microsporus]CEI91786.1 hypothetical protein RMCBS344292_06066 [Rhizopus microsporus]
MASSDLPFPNSTRNDSLFGGARLGRRKRTVFLLLLFVVFFVLWFNSDLNRVSNEVHNVSQEDQLADKNYRPVEPVVEDEVIDDEPTTAQDDIESTYDKPTQAQKPPVQPKPDLTIEEPTIAKSSHYKYFIIIASRVGNASRRQLIRNTYFGLQDNLEPCMKRDKGIQYLFWMYGDLPKAKTAERRMYETEKMEWNDFVKVKTDAYDQDAVLRWARDYLKRNEITFDYLVIQDGYSFTHLSYIQQTIDKEKNNLPTTSGTDMVWFNPQLKNVVVTGSSAFDKLWEYESDIADITNSAPDSSLLVSLYRLNKAVGIQRKIIESESEGDRLSEFFKFPVFLGEQNRMITWSNNVETVPDLTVSVANVYQDADFASLTQKLRLGATPICKAIDKPDIAVVTSSFIYPDSCMEKAAPPAADNKREYALAHNYAFVARSTEYAQQDLRTEKRRTVWGKIDVVQKVLPKYEWIFWLDMDAVIMNPKHTVQGILDDLRSKYPGGPEKFEENIDLVIAKPTRDKMINAGVFFMRNTKWAQTFLKDVQNFKKWYNQSPSYEQGAMWELIQLDKHKSHVLLLDNDDHTFNTLPKRYTPGDFIVHFAPDKCPGPAVLEGLEAVKRIQNGEVFTHFEES